MFNFYLIGKDLVVDRPAFEVFEWSGIDEIEVKGGGCTCSGSWVGGNVARAESSDDSEEGRFGEFVDALGCTIELDDVLGADGEAG